MNCIRHDISIHANIPWIVALRVVNGALENSIVVIVIVEFISDTIVVMIKGVGAITAVESFN